MQQVEIKPYRKMHDEVHSTLKQHYSLGLCASGTSHCSDSIRINWHGINSWMLTTDLNSKPMFSELQKLLSDYAAVFDQGQARALFELSGKSVRKILSRLCSLDLHPCVFQPDRCALTKIGHFNAHLLQVDAQPTFRIQVFRSYAASFYESIVEASAGESLLFQQSLID